MAPPLVAAPAPAAATEVRAHNPEMSGGRDLAGPAPPARTSELEGGDRGHAPRSRLEGEPDETDGRHACTTEPHEESEIHTDASPHEVTDHYRSAAQQFKRIAETQLPKLVRSRQERQAHSRRGVASADEGRATAVTRP